MDRLCRLCPAFFTDRWSKYVGQGPASATVRNCLSLIHPVLICHESVAFLRCYLVIFFFRLCAIIPFEGYLPFDKWLGHCPLDSYYKGCIHVK